MDCCNTSDSKKNKHKHCAENKHLSEGKTTANKSFISYISSFTGFSGIFSSYQVCHSICLGVITLLSLIGITLTGLPFLFLQKIALPLWIAAIILFAIALFIFYKHSLHISKNLLIFNSGAIITGIPFQSLSSFRKFFLAIGLAIIVFSIYLMIKSKFGGKQNGKYR